MGKISPDTFNQSKQYVNVRLQQGVPIVDADWNEMDDIRKHEHQTFLQEHKLPLLEKPGSLDKLMEHISLILQRSRNRVAANAA